MWSHLGSAKGNAERFFSVNGEIPKAFPCEVAYYKQCHTSAVYTTNNQWRRQKNEENGTQRVEEIKAWMNMECLDLFFVKDKRRNVANGKNFEGSAQKVGKWVAKKKILTIPFLNLSLTSWRMFGRLNKYIFSIQTFH